MIEGLLFGFAIVFGLGTLFPWLSFGYALLMGSVVVPLILFVGNTFLGIPLSWVGIFLIGVSICSVVKRAFNINNRSVDLWQKFYLHPGLILPICIILVGMFANYSSYLVWSFDEFASWGSWAKQIYIADTYWREGMVDSMRHYPKSWPMTVAFAQLPFEKYDEFRGIAFLAIFHVAILAIFFDLIKLVLERESGISQKLSFVISWLIILFLISIEASWELLPPSLLIERAVMYWSIGLFTLGFFAWYSKNSQMQYLMSMGIILASALGLKTPTMSLAIPAALIGLLYWKSQFSEAQSSVSKISLIKIAACLLLPLAIILTMWISHTSQQSIKVGLDINFDETFIERFFNLSALLKEAFTNYLVSFKSPLTGAGIIGLITALWFPNQRGVAIALLTYIVLSWLGMWPLYLFSIGGNEHEALPSFQRYVRVPIRLIHYFGAALFLINIFTFLKLREYPFIKVIFRAKYLFRASGILIVLLGGFQIWSINRSYLDMEFRIFGSTTSAPHRAAKIRSFKAQSERLNTLIKELRLATPSTLLISQNGDGFVQRMAHYYSISDSKHSKLFNYKLISQWSWGPVSNNMWMRKTTVEDFGKFVAAKDIIWPYKLDSWTTNILLNFIDNEKCRENISDYFLIKQKNKFQCFANFSR